jgi:hypothetical protein
MNATKSIYRSLNKQCQNDYHNLSKHSPPSDIQSFNLLIQFLNAFSLYFRGILFRH